MRLISLLFCIALTLVSAQAYGQKVSVLVAVTYDVDKDTTFYLQYPYPTIKLPGQWEDLGDNRKQGVKYFQREDSVQVAVGTPRRKAYPIYSKKQTPEEFLEAWFVWEIDYLKANNNHPVLLADSTLNGFRYKLWQNGKQIYLYGAKGDFSFNFFTSTHRWSETEARRWLLALYANT